MNMKTLNIIAKVLVEYAENHKVITYNELSKRIDGQLSPRNLGDPIGRLSEISHELGLPLISVIVVNQETTIPGDGYYRFAASIKGISEVQAMNDFQQETEDCKQCEDWSKLLGYIDIHEVVKPVITRIIRKPLKVINTTPKCWIAVHDINAYTQNSRLLGFTDKVNQAKNIKPGDIIVYYLTKSSTIKGIYTVCPEPWIPDPRWRNPHQIQIDPIIELEDAIDIRPMVADIDLFVNKKKWNTHIQGTNSVRLLTEHDFKIIETNVYNAAITNNELEYVGTLNDDNVIPNETIDAKIKRIKRDQKLVAILKDKYSNKCQICNDTFKKKNGGYYSEGHHIEYLSKGGHQDEKNMVILCATHHRMFHYADVKIFNLIGKMRKVSFNNIDCYIKYI